MPVTVTEFQENIAHYLQLVSKQDVLIMQDGKVIAKLTQPPKDKVSVAKSLFGILPQKLTKREDSDEVTAAINSLVGVLPDEGMTLAEYKAERLAKYEKTE